MREITFQQFCTRAYCQFDKAQEMSERIAFTMPSRCGEFVVLIEIHEQRREVRVKGLSPEGDGEGGRRERRKRSYLILHFEGLNY